MLERLKELRKLLNLNQGQFADKIGIKQGSLSDIERGKVGISNRIVVIICKTFNVSEEWFRNGVGSPFLNEYEHREDLSEFEKNILQKFNILNENERKAVESIIDSLYQKTIKN